jgi:superoxide dismutase, Fe-Mn family
MMPINRRDMLKAAGTGAAILALPDLALAANENPEQFTLPKLPYAFDALEPHIDAKTMEIHHDRHHAGYVKNLNAAIKDTDLVGKKIEEILMHLDKAPEKIRTAVRNNGGGHFNHSLFWQMMAPKGGKPAGPLNDAIAGAFVDLSGMFKQFKTAAMTRFGSGWAWLVADKAGKLKIVSSPNQDSTIMAEAPTHGTPILGIDVWEHAYYLKYQNKRDAYVDAFFNVINWEFVTSRYEEAIKKA